MYSKFPWYLLNVPLLISDSVKLGSSLFVSWIKVLSLLSILSEKKAVKNHWCFSYCFNVISVSFVNVLIFITSYCWLVWIQFIFVFPINSIIKPFVCAFSDFLLNFYWFFVEFTSCILIPLSPIFSNLTSVLETIHHIQTKFKRKSQNQAKKKQKQRRGGGGILSWNL